MFVYFEKYKAMSNHRGFCSNRFKEMDWNKAFNIYLDGDVDSLKYQIGSKEQIKMKNKRIDNNKRVQKFQKKQKMENQQEQY